MSTPPQSPPPSYSPFASLSSSPMSRLHAFPPPYPYPDPPRTHSVCPIKFVFTMLTHTWPDDRAQFALSISLVPKCRREVEGPIEQHFAFSKQQKRIIFAQFNLIIR